MAATPSVQALKINQKGYIKMKLNFRTAEFAKIAKYKADSGKWYARNGDADIEVPEQTFVADIENSRTGWVKFAPGNAPADRGPDTGSKRYLGRLVREHHEKPRILVAPIPKQDD